MTGGEMVISPIEIIMQGVPALVAGAVAYGAGKVSLRHLTDRVHLLEARESWVQRKLQQMGSHHNTIHREHQVELDDYPQGGA